MSRPLNFYQVFRLTRNKKNEDVMDNVTVISNAKAAKKLGKELAAKIKGDDQVIVGKLDVIAGYTA
jgi:hypothetical protein